MTTTELTAIIDGLAPEIRAYVGESLKALSARVLVLEAREVIHGKDGRDGIDGKDGRDAEAPSLESIAVAAAALIPVPKDGINGRDGIDGKDGANGQDGALGHDGRDGQDAEPITPEIVLEALRASPVLIQRAVDTYVDAHPPEAGKDGTDGLNGKDGQDGSDGKDGQDGADGQDGKDGSDGINGKDGAPGINGKDGQGIVAASISQDGELLLTMTDGVIKNAGMVVGKSGTNGRDGLPGRTGDDGKDGLDGLGFDDIDVQHDGERSFTFTFVRGDRKKTFGTFTIPSLIYRGVFQQGMSYGTGDCVTWGGSLFVAQTGTKAKPETNADWRLAVKRGQDGKK